MKSPSFPPSINFLSGGHVRRFIVPVLCKFSFNRSQLTLQRSRLASISSQEVTQEVSMFPSCLNFLSTGHAEPTSPCLESSKSTHLAFLFFQTHKRFAYLISFRQFSPFLYIPCSTSTFSVK